MSAVTTGSSEPVDKPASRSASAANPPYPPAASAPKTALALAVLDGERFLGVLTPRALHEALRRSVEADVRGVNPADVELTSIP